ncbi:unnamed protein product [Clonostachys byssicola]|uniref:Ketoreductase domain-containing protein n=1 Tax=Clonostachys byssicola TaxID=160290 RepID=A0A9N9Y551_9HYPO|nr:unnamed protein product [Clonostachys byssicola]
MSMTEEQCRIDDRDSRPTPDIPNNVMDQFKMNGKVSIVTGASRGIGAAIAEGLAEAGSHLVLVYSSHNPSMDERAKQLAKIHGVRVSNVRCDVTNFEAVKDLVARVRTDFGRVDVFVANAGVCNPNPILESSLEDYHAEMNVNVHGVVYCAKAIGPFFKQQGFGNFIITTSICASVVTVPVDHVAYNTSKAAALHFGKSIAREWRGFARVNMVSPGWIDTAMSEDRASLNEARRMAPLGRLGDVRELKAAYLYLASSASSFVTGAEIVVDGGYTLP